MFFFSHFICVYHCNSQTACYRGLYNSSLVHAGPNSSCRFLQLLLSPWQQMVSWNTYFLSALCCWSHVSPCLKHQGNANSMLLSLILLLRTAVQGSAAVRVTVTPSYQPSTNPSTTKTSRSLLSLSIKAKIVRGCFQPSS